MMQEVEGQTHLQGRLDFDTVPKLWKALQAQIRGNAHVTLDLSQVEYADSAALALLLQAQEEAEQQAHTISLQHIPQDLIDLARLSNVDTLLTDAT